MKSYTHIAMVLDRSGSMDVMQREIIGGFNGFLEDQKKVEGKATMTLVQFDNEIDRLATFKDIKEMQPLTDKTYVPRGCTRLYDAVGLTVNTTKEEIRKAKKKPDKVLVVILTDGLENASQEYTTAQIKELLEERQKAGWEFTFIGANQDAILTARGIGLNNAASNISYAATPDGATNIMASLSNATAVYRCAVGGSKLSYTQEDRDAQSIDPATVHGWAGNVARKEDGSKSGKAGGTVRAQLLSAIRRSKIASAAAKARWSKNSV